MEMVSCAKCEVAGDLNDIEFKFSDPYYADQILAQAKKLTTYA